MVTTTPKVALPADLPPAYLHTFDTPLNSNLTTNNSESVFKAPTGYSAFVSSEGESLINVAIDCFEQLTELNSSGSGSMSDYLKQIAANTVTVVAGRNATRVRATQPMNLGSSLYTYGHTNDEGDGYMTNAEATGYALYRTSNDGLPNFDEPYLGQIVNQLGGIATRLDSMFELLERTLIAWIPLSLSRVDDTITAAGPVGLGELMLRAMFATNPLSITSDMIYFTNVPYLSSNALTNMTYDSATGKVFRQLFEPEYPLPIPQSYQNDLLGIPPTGGSIYPGDLDPFVRLSTSTNVLIAGPLPSQSYVASLVPLSTERDVSSLGKAPGDFNSPINDV